jgi:hypothetical protein
LDALEVFLFIAARGLEAENRGLRCARAVLGRFDAQAQAQRFDDEAEAREAGVSVFGERSVEGFAVEAGGVRELSDAALGVDDVAETDEEDFVAFFEAGGEVAGCASWVFEPFE